MSASLRLILGQRAAELQACEALGAVSSRIEVGYVTLEELFFPNGRLDASALERAIEWTEDRIQAARFQFPAGTQLYTSDADMLELARVSGATDGPIRALHVDAVEQTFSRLVLQSMGQHSSLDALPETSRFFATVVFVRELMHHLNFPLIHVSDQVEIAKVCF
jgi:exopolyphosphatase/pppGpp-phosphohydrolase